MHRRSFGDGGGAVGLRIVIGSGPAREGNPTQTRSDPIPIRPGAGPSVEGSEDEEDMVEEEEEEMTESYTCVTSHVGGMAVRKRVYFDDGTGGKYGRRSGVFLESPMPGAGVGPTSPGGFLSRCHLCGKKLHGLDIFMYRGDKAFCSVECRCQQILTDENKERCRSDQAVEPYDYSVSPYPSPLLFAAGVAAA